MLDMARFIFLFYNDNSNDKQINKIPNDFIEFMIYFLLGYYE